MKKLIVVLGLSVLAVQGSMAAEFTGYVSDAKCAALGAKAKTATEWIKPAEFEACVKDCLSKGSDVVFVTEDNKTLKFDGASLEKIKAHYGHKVRVSGKVANGMLTVDTVTMLKMQ